MNLIEKKKKKTVRRKMKNKIENKNKKNDPIKFILFET